MKQKIPQTIRFPFVRLALSVLLMLTLLLVLPVAVSAAESTCNHIWSYSASGNMFLAECEKDGCHVAGASVLIFQPAGALVYDTAEKAASVGSNIDDSLQDSIQISDISYQKSDGGAWVACGTPFDAGAYKATVTVTVSGQQYPLELTYSVTAADLSLDASNASISFSDKNYDFTYKGSAHEPEVDVFLNGAELDGSDYEVSYSNSENAGTATVTVTGKNNCMGTIKKSFEIAKRPLTATVTVADKQYDGLSSATVSSVEITTGKISGDDVSVREGSVTASFSSTSVGDGISIVLSGYELIGTDADNYTLTLNPAVADIYNRFTGENTYTLNTVGGVAENGTFTVTAKSGYLLSQNGTDAGPWRSSLSVTGEAENETFTFYVRDTATWAISKAVSETYTIDTLPPVIGGITNGGILYTTTQVTVSDNHTVSVTVNGEAAELSFLLAGNTEKTYTVTATDIGGNTVSVTVTMKRISSLSEALEGLTAKNVKATDMSVIRSAESAVKEVDISHATAAEKRALNDILDLCEELRSRITDVDLEIKRIRTAVTGYDPATVNSSHIGALQQLLLDISALTSTDNLTAAQRSELAELRKTVEELILVIGGDAAEIVRLTGAMDAYDIETVKSTDRGDIEALIADMDKLLKGTNLTELERALLEQAKSYGASLIGRIEIAAEAVSSENVRASEKITESTVRKSDRTLLEAAKAELENAIAMYPGNYTDSERAEVDSDLAHVNALLEILLRVEAAEDRIDKLPDASLVRPNDIDTSNRYDEAEDAFEDLTDYEQSLVDSDKKDELSAVKDALTDYHVTAEGEASWDKGSEDSFSVISNGAVSKIVAVKVDGEVLSEDSYTVAKDGTITLFPQYLETLKAGTHTLTVEYTDGEAELEFMVRGNGTLVVLWIILILLLLTVIGASIFLVLFFMKKKKKDPVV